MWLKKKNDLIDFHECDECGGLFRMSKMVKVEVIRRPHYKQLFEPYLSHNYYCVHCKKPN